LRHSLAIKNIEVDSVNKSKISGPLDTSKAANTAIQKQKKMLQYDKGRNKYNLTPSDS
jgi:hypothetical protein